MNKKKTVDNVNLVEDRIDALLEESPNHTALTLHNVLYEEGFIDLKVKDVEKYLEEK